MLAAEKAQAKKDLKRKKKQREDSNSNSRSPKHASHANASKMASSFSKAMRNTTSSKYKSQKQPDTPENADSEDEAMKKKADVKDLMALNEIKSNKFDTEILMRCVDI